MAVDQGDTSFKQNTMDSYQRCLEPPFQVPQKPINDKAEAAIVPLKRPYSSCIVGATSRGRHFEQPGSNDFFKKKTWTPKKKYWLHPGKLPSGPTKRESSENHWLAQVPKGRGYVIVPKEG